MRSTTKATSRARGAGFAAGRERRYNLPKFTTGRIAVGKRGESDLMKKWDAAQVVIAELIATEEAAERMGITRWQVRNLIKQGKIMGKQVGRAWLVYAPSIKRFERSSKGRPAGA